MDTTCMIWQVAQEYGNSINLEPIPVHILYGHKDTVVSVDVSNELDMVVSGSLDGSINIHTLRHGSYVKTLSFMNEKIRLFTSMNLKLSNERHMLVYVSGEACERADDYSHVKKMIYELYLFSVNGNLICKELLNYPVQDMIIKDDYCVLAVSVNSNSGKSQGGLNSSFGKIEPDFVGKQSSKIIFKEYFE